MASCILLRGGTLLVHDDNDRVVPTKADLLIEGAQITQLADHIDAPESAIVYDCRNKLISPGFISTHNHIWQTQLKGRHADQTLLEYLPCGDSVFRSTENAGH